MAAFGRALSVMPPCLQEISKSCLLSLALLSSCRSFAQTVSAMVCSGRMFEGFPSSSSRVFPQTSVIFRWLEDSGSSCLEEIDVIGLSCLFETLEDGLPLCLPQLIVHSWNYKEDYSYPFSGYSVCYCEDFFCWISSSLRLNIIPFSLMISRANL